MTFRCEALDFRISKSQKKVLKRMVKFLRNELTRDNIADMNEDQQDNIGKTYKNLSNKCENCLTIIFSIITVRSIILCNINYYRYKQRRSIKLC